MNTYTRRRAAEILGALLLGLTVGVAGEPARAQPAAADPATEILALEAANNEAIFHGDAAAVARMTSEDHSFITPRGFLVDRAQMLDAVTRGEFEFAYRQIYDLKVRVYADAAVVTGRVRFTRQVDGRDRSDAFRYTRTYVRRQGRWLAVAWQATREDELTRAY